MAAEAWRRIGNVHNAIEPFCFSAAWILARPGGAGPIETVNDLNAYVSNFWRAVQRDPEAVAVAADWPVNETDLHARHRWLVNSEAAQASLAKVREDPDYFDARMAGWWCWGACCWIGSGWCDAQEPSQQLPQIAGKGGSPVNGGVLSWSGFGPRENLPSLRGDAGCTGTGVTSQGPAERQPALGQAGWGINAKGHEKRHRVPWNEGGYAPGVINQSPATGMSGNMTSPDSRRLDYNAHGNGTGVARLHIADDTHRPQLADAFSRGRGVNGNDALGTCDRRREWITGWMLALADRLRPVRVCCGHWARVCDSESTMTRLGTTGVFLDPPYRKELACGKKNRTSHIYANDKVQDVGALCDEVEAWCLRWGPNPEVRIALCGLEGEYPAIEAAGWDVFAWKSNGGYGNQSGKKNDNAARERIWFSPACRANEASNLFSREEPPCPR